MMSALFLLMLLVLGGIYWGKHTFGITILLITLALCGLMLWYHATDVLQINW